MKSTRSLCFETTARLTAQQRKFWDGQPEMSGVEIHGPLLVPLKKIYISDEHPEPESLPPYRQLIRQGRKLPPILVVPPHRRGGRFRVVDGKHRVAACRLEKATHLLVLTEGASPSRRR